MSAQRISVLCRGLKALPFQPQLKKTYRFCLGLLRTLPFLKPAAATQIAASYLDLHGKTVLVVGCNTGNDCRVFLEMGAREVHGVDVVDEVGAEYPHPQVRYYKMSVESMDLKSDLYDLVFCFATMEHVPRIDLAFSEMVRVAKPGGVIYCVAAPLWNSQQGHHKSDFFENYPWIHLRLTEAEILEYCRAHNITDPTGRHTMDEHVEYMLHPKFFNKVAAAQYVNICKSLRDVEILSNELAWDEEESLTPAIYSELEPKGYPRNELLAGRHTFIAKKLKVA